MKTSKNSGHCELAVINISKKQGFTVSLIGSNSVTELGPPVTSALLTLLIYSRVFGFFSLLPANWTASWVAASSLVYFSQWISARNLARSAREERWLRRFVLRSLVLIGFIGLAISLADWRQRKAMLSQGEILIALLLLASFLQGVLINNRKGAASSTTKALNACGAAFLCGVALYFGSNLTKVEIPIVHLSTIFLIAIAPSQFLLYEIFRLGSESRWNLERAALIAGSLLLVAGIGAL